MSREIEQDIIGCLIDGGCAGELFAELSADELQSTEAAAIFARLREVWRQHGSLDRSAIRALSEEQQSYAQTACEGLTTKNAPLLISMLRDENTVSAGYAAAYQFIHSTSASEVRSLARELVRATSGVERAQAVSLKEGFMRFMDCQQEPRSYIRTGYSTIDDHASLARGDFVIIGGRPSSGKTALSLNMAVNIARNGYKVVFFSLETSVDRLIDRTVTYCAGLDFSLVKRQKLTDEWVAVADACAYYNDMPLFFIQASGRSVDWIEAEALRLEAEVIFVDYIGIVKADGGSRYEKMTEISIGLHNLAQRNRIAVFGLSQLNRAGAAENPRMEDLRESGQIEQDADLIMLLHDSKEGYRVNIEKNKEGRCGQVKMHFDKTKQRFTEMVSV